MHANSLDDAFKLSEEAENNNEVVVVLKGASILSEENFSGVLVKLVDALPEAGVVEMADYGAYFKPFDKTQDIEDFQRVIETAIKSSGFTRSDLIVGLKTQAQADKIIRPVVSCEEKPELVA